MRWIAWVLLIWRCVPVHAQEPAYYFEQITSHEGITFNAVSSVLEDDRGFIWFGTAGGLYFYNSAEIQQYRFDPNDERTPPSNNITSLYKDAAGRIWVATDNGICYFDEYGNDFIRFPLHFGESPLSATHLLQYDDRTYLVIVAGKLYRFAIDVPRLDPVATGLEATDITLLSRLPDNRIYLGSNQGHLLRQRGGTLSFEVVCQAPAQVNAVCQVGDEIWLGLEKGGVCRVTTKGDSLGMLQPAPESPDAIKDLFGSAIRKIICRPDGAVWFGTIKGLGIIRKEGLAYTLRHVTRGLPHSGIFELYTDQNDGVWIGTWSGGLAYYQASNYAFPHVKLPATDDAGARSVISSFGETRQGDIWVGVENGDLRQFHPIDGTFSSPATWGGDAAPQRVKAIGATKDVAHHWFGTLYNGLYRETERGFECYEAATGITSSVCVTEGGVWVGTRGEGLIYYDTEHEREVRYTVANSKLGSDFIWQVYADSRHNIWVCSEGGLSVKYFGQQQFEHFRHQNDGAGLSRNLNYTIAEDQQGQLWVGSAGAGIDIFNPSTKRFAPFAHNASISRAEVYSILPDQSGNLWFSTNQGIYAYYPKPDRLRHFTAQDGVMGKQYHPNSGFISSTGKLFFGGGNGFNVIDPARVSTNSLIPEVYISSLHVNNEPFAALPPETFNSRFPPAIDHLKLAYDQNTLTFSLVANNLIKPRDNQFRYRMRGYLDEWIEVPHGADISFTKIPHGDYVLELLASNNDGVWSTEAKRIHIEVSPPFWLAWYAWLTYAVLATLAAFLLLRELHFREQTRASESLFAEKVKFFTNVSHELRTPLTLVISPLGRLMERYASDPVAYSYLNTIKRNTERLIHLTNQIMDFRLIELGHIKLRTEEVDLVSLCDETFAYFEYDARGKQIDCVFITPFPNFHHKVDAAKIEIVIYNLLSNALKHSPECSRVSLDIRQQELGEADYQNVFTEGKRVIGEAVSISVSDMGKGIDAATLPHIFDRFYHKDDQVNTGIGIGLHMCQEYVQLHGGNIMVQTAPGAGTTFTVNLPLNQPVERTLEERVVHHYFNEAKAPKGITAEAQGLRSRRLILYAEDNDELRTYLKRVLSGHYKVLTAKNGPQALQISRESQPDLILADVLLPGMTGLELTRQVKADPATSCIPIILLTALSDKRHKMDSMSSGVHTFITKPVDEAFLLAMIDNIFRSRQALISDIKHKITQAGTELDPRSTFLEKARKLVTDNLGNTAFSVADFADQLNVSRSSLQRKLKSDANLSPNEFIRNLRLVKAVELLKTNTYNVDEIAVLVGFNSTSYFIRSFKKQYGETPHAFQMGMRGRG